MLMKRRTVDHKSCPRLASCLATLSNYYNCCTHIHSHIRIFILLWSWQKLCFLFDFSVVWVWKRVYVCRGSLSTHTILKTFAHQISKQHVSRSLLDLLPLSGKFISRCVGRGREQRSRAPVAKNHQRLSPTYGKVNELKLLPLPVPKILVFLCMSPLFKGRVH